MKIIKLIKASKPTMSEDVIQGFLYKNCSDEMIKGLEYDDPKTIDRVLKLLGLENRAHGEHNAASASNDTYEKTAAS